jgi:PAS domain S-box-containing protein
MKENRSLDFKARFNECEQRFKAVFSLTSAATKIINNELTIIEVNDALIELLDILQMRYVAQRSWNSPAMNIREHGRSCRKPCGSTENHFFKIDVCLKKKDGTLVWVHVTTIMFTESGEKFAYSVLDDFTFMKEYQESQKRLEMSLKYSKMAVWELDMDNGTVVHSGGLPLILAIEGQNESLKKSDLTSTFIPEDAEDLSLILAGLNHESSLDFKGRVVSSSGQIKWIHLQGKSGLAPSNRKVILGTARDITSEKLTDRYKDDFISIASHELKTL